MYIVQKIRHISYDSVLEMYKRWNKLNRKVICSTLKFSFDADSRKYQKAVHGIVMHHTVLLK